MIQVVLFVFSLFYVGYDWLTSGGERKISRSSLSILVSLTLSVLCYVLSAVYQRFVGCRMIGECYNGEYWQEAFDLKVIGTGLLLVSAIYSLALLLLVLKRRLVR